MNQTTGSAGQYPLITNALREIDPKGVGFPHVRAALRAHERAARLRDGEIDTAELFAIIPPPAA